MVPIQFRALSKPTSSLLPLQKPGPASIWTPFDTISCWSHASDHGATTRQGFQNRSLYKQRSLGSTSTAASPDFPHLPQCL